MATKFTDKPHGFSVTVPDGWSQVTTPGTAAAFKSPTSSAGFTPNINVVVAELPGAMSVQDYAKASAAQFEQALPGAKRANVANGVMGGAPAVAQVYTATVQGRPLVFSQVLTVVGKRAYVVTGTTILDQATSISSQLASFVKSFTLLK